MCVCAQRGDPAQLATAWVRGWSTFERNHLHETWACDFLQGYDVWFRPISAFFIMALGSRQVVHVAATRTPTATWVAQQLRNATPFGEGPRLIIRDNDEDVALKLFPLCSQTLPCSFRTARIHRYAMDGRDEPAKRVNGAKLQVFVWFSRRVRFPAPPLKYLE